MQAGAKHYRGALLFVVNVSWFFLSHRLSLAKAALASGYEVHLATSITSPEDEAEIRSAGIAVHNIDMQRSASAPVADIATVWALIRLMRRIRPNLVHLVGMKPLLLGKISARLARVPIVVGAVTGLGQAFQSCGERLSVRGWLLVSLMRVLASGRRTALIFQNEEDRGIFLRHRLIEVEAAFLIRGSGVDLMRFKPLPEPAPPLRILLASRMLKSKGVPEFVEAASLLRGRWPTVQFLLAGDPDAGNAVSLTVAQLEDWHARSVVVWLRHIPDMARLLSTVHLVVLPTYYGEGVPKVLIEAAASGRAIVTTNTPGCRDIVRHEDNGLLIPHRDVPALVHALDRLLSDQSLRVSMGSRGAEIAAAEFGEEQVISRTLQIYDRLLQTLQKSCSTAER